MSGTIFWSQRSKGGIGSVHGSHYPVVIQMKQEPLTAVDKAWIAEAEKRFAAWKRKATKAGAARTALSEIRKELCH